MTTDAAWLSTGERGAVLGIRFVVWLCTAFGRRAARAFLRVLALYYVLFHPGVRRASRRYLSKLHPAVTFGMVYRHVRTFAECTLDRLFLLRGRDDLFEVHRHGHDLLVALQREKRGAILLGAHLGSFEAMRMQAHATDVRVNVLGYFRNAKMVNAALAALSPLATTRLVEIEPDGVGFMLQVKELIERGELVAMLGDRTGLGGQSVEADFLGAPARFPTGPYLVAAALRCPVLLTFGLYTAPNRYDLYCEPFADAADLPRRGRAEAVAALARRYAERLEHYTRLRPDNWFNFFDFWSAGR